MINSVFHQSIDPWSVQPIGSFDYARAKQGGLDVAVEHLYIEDAYNKYNYTVKQACRLIETFYGVLEANTDRMELALTSQDVRRIAAQGKLAVILALEGGFDMEGDPDVLRLFHRLGVRMVQLANHDTTNALTDALDVRKWNGISERGREIIREMNRLGIVIDISHASDSSKERNHRGEPGPGGDQSQRTAAFQFVSGEPHRRDSQSPGNKRRARRAAHRRLDPQRRILPMGISSSANDATSSVGRTFESGVVSATVGLWRLHCPT